jgi:permuted papain-like amidase YaeF/Yiix C92 family enzyme
MESALKAAAASEIPAELTGEITAVDARALLPGDIILSTSTGFVSWLIRVSTGSVISHAALHIGHGIAIEANDPGVVQTFLPAIGYAHASRLVVKRMPDLTSKQRDDIASHARALLYRPYSTRGAIGAVLAGLRSTRDPGRFCSQLVAQCYDLARAPICEKSPEECTPDDILRAGRLKCVKEGIRRIDMAVHAAVVSPYADRYSHYLQSGTANETALVDKLKQKIQLSAVDDSFNLCDLARQTLHASISNEARKSADQLIALEIMKSIKQTPLRPCPGVAIATYMLNPMPLPPLFTWPASIVYETEKGRQAMQRMIEDVGVAAKWELEDWVNEGAKLMEQHKATDHASFGALASWMINTAFVRMKYSRLCAASARPGTIPRIETETFKEELKTMIKTDPVGAEEFSLDPFQLLEQNVPSFR